MIDLRQAKRVAIIGSDIGGWFAALTLRRIFSSAVEIVVFEDPKKTDIGIGEGGLNNLIQSLNRNKIDVEEFVRESGATFKLGTSFEGWRNGEKSDVFYHLSPMIGEQVQELEFIAFGIMPLLAARVSAGADLHSFFPGFSLIQDNASQIEARAVLATKRSGLAPSYHFHHQKAEQYLKSVALKRGIKHRLMKVDKLLLTSEGLTYALKVEGEEVAVDFVVDASGFKRIAMGETYKEKWQSFKDFQILDRVLPFSTAHPQKNPALLTNAVAMSSGWMSQIPLQDQVSASYIFSSKHISEDHARKEIEHYVGHDITPMGLIRFDPGNFETAWRKNVLALGAASGFIDLLEATSSGQMFEQLRNVEKVFIDGRGVIGNNIIDSFNRSNNEGWLGLIDFCRMHFEGGRDDTRFWKDVSKLPRSDRYQELRACFDHRLPRMLDIENYIGHGWAPIFHMVNWLLVGAPLNLITARAGASELLGLPTSLREQITPYMSRLQNMGLNGRNNMNDFQDSELIRLIMSGDMRETDYQQRLG
ncbi:tryptophan 7-halogenase [Bartonella tamiae]|uniref:tryptophan 7-halogenase n=1 Tax=Bartonella tamiae TaxID=373638 RepID=UPI00026E776D|nr:tryptophan 7-halogenase [Bartonella tamiae]EJF95561.1 hypothetical protein MEG_00051 [Bartonella tamiae Th307]